MDALLVFFFLLKCESSFGIGLCFAVKLNSVGFFNFNLKKKKVVLDRVKKTPVWPRLYAFAFG